MLLCSHLNLLDRVIFRSILILHIYYHQNQFQHGKKRKYWQIIFNLFFCSLRADLSPAKYRSNRAGVFERSRWKLASWYAGMLGVVLSLCGLAVYQAIAHAHKLTLDQEIETVANNIHETLEPILQEPGQLEALETKIVPRICSLISNCYFLPPARANTEQIIRLILLL